MYGTRNKIQSKSWRKKMIKTLFYGVKSSGNQAECALRETAKLAQDEYTQITQLVSKDIYVDNCISGGTSAQETKKIAYDLEVVLGRDFYLKGSHF